MHFTVYLFPNIVKHFIQNQGNFMIPFYVKGLYYPTLSKTKKMMRRALLIISIMILPVALIISCSKSSPGNDDSGTPINCDGVSKNYTTDVNPIIQTFCNQAACHDAGSTKGPGQLTNYTEVFNARIQIREAVRSGVMPQNATLSTAQKNTIICWIDNGAANN